MLALSWAVRLVAASTAPFSQGSQSPGPPGRNKPEATVSITRLNTSPGLVKSELALTIHFCTNSCSICNSNKQELEINLTLNVPFYVISQAGLWVSSVQPNLNVRLKTILFGHAVPVSLHNQCMTREGGGGFTYPRIKHPPGGYTSTDILEHSHNDNAGGKVVGHGLWTQEEMQ